MSYSDIHQEFLLGGQTVENEYYLGAMRFLNKSIRNKRHEMWQSNL